LNVIFFVFVSSFFTIESLYVLKIKTPSPKGGGVRRERDEG